MDERRKHGAIHLDSLGPHGLQTRAKTGGRLPHTNSRQHRRRSNRTLLRARHVHSARSSPGETGASQFHTDHCDHLQRPALPAHVRHLHLAHHEAISRFPNEPVADDEYSSKHSGSVGRIPPIVAKWESYEWSNGEKLVRCSTST